MARSLIVTGPPRCGTTVLVDILNRHPKVALTSENDMARIYEHIFAAFDKMREHDIFLQETSSAAEASAAIQKEDYDQLADQRRNGFINSPEHEGSSLNFQEKIQFVLEAFYQAATGKENFAWFGDKMPQVQLKTNFVNVVEHYKIDMTYVFIFRDPLSMVASSNRRWKDTQKGKDNWDISNVREALSIWLDCWMYCQKLVDAGEEVHIIKYIDLVEDTQNQIRKLFNFLSLKEPPTGFELINTPMEIQTQHLSKEDKVFVDDILGRLRKAWDKPIEDLIQDNDLLLPEAQIGLNLNFSKIDALDKRFLKTGFYHPDSWCCWSHPTAEINFTLPKKNRPKTLKLKSSAYISEHQKKGMVEVWLNDVSVGQAKPEDMHPDKGGYTFEIELPEKGEQFVLRLNNARSKCPEDAPVEDTRALGLAFMNMCFS